MHRFVSGLARAMAIAGGVVLVALVTLTCLSVIGRAGNSIAHAQVVIDVLPGVSQLLITSGVGPIAGDFELVEAGVAFAIFAFLPWCQMRRGHATVDVFAAFLPTPANRLIDALSELLLTLVTILITWRLGLGMLDKLNYGETTLLLQFPIWWAYAASLGAAVTVSLVAMYSTGVRLRDWWAGIEELTLTDGEH